MCSDLVTNGAQRGHGPDLRSRTESLATRMPRRSLASGGLPSRGPSHLCLYEPPVDQNWRSRWYGTN